MPDEIQKCDSDNEPKEAADQHIYNYFKKPFALVLFAALLGGLAIFAGGGFIKGTFATIVMFVFVSFLAFIFFRNPKIKLNKSEQRIGITICVIVFGCVSGHSIFTSPSDISTGANSIPSSKDTPVVKPDTSQIIKTITKTEKNPRLTKMNVAPGAIGTINQQGDNTINNITINSSDRVIPPNIFEILKARLRQYPKKRVYFVMAYNVPPANEITKFSDQLRDLFISSHWDVEFVNSHNLPATDAGATGVSVDPIGQVNIPIADFISKHFRTLGYRLSKKVYETPDRPFDLHIEVGEK